MVGIQIDWIDCIFPPSSHLDCPTPLQHVLGLTTVKALKCKWKHEGTNTVELPVVVETTTRWGWKPTGRRVEMKKDTIEGSGGECSMRNGAPLEDGAARRDRVRQRVQNHPTSDTREERAARQEAEEDIPQLRKATKEARRCQLSRDQMNEGHRGVFTGENQYRCFRLLHSSSGQLWTHGSAT